MPRAWPRVLFVCMHTRAPGLAVLPENGQVELELNTLLASNPKGTTGKRGNST